MHYSFAFLVGLLFLLLLAAVFFSLAEAAMLSINRYRLRHLVRQRNLLAKHVQDLLKKTRSFARSYSFMRNFC